MIRSAAVAAVLTFLASCSSGPAPVPGPADLIVHHAKIVTVDANFSIAEAMAVKDGRIVAM